MELTRESLNQYAAAQGLDLLGVANIERFDGAPMRMHPASIFPEARSVIVVGKRILRGGWRGIEEGTHWPAYTYFDYHGLLNSHFIPTPLYELACFIEDHGWEAVPYYSGVPERQPNSEPLREGGVPADVELAVRQAGVAAGLGEIGWSKVFLNKRFGPRVRLHAIITDLELDPDPLVEPGSICNRCMSCVKGCPGAIPHIREGKTLSIQIEDKIYEWGDVDMGTCTLAHCGGDPRFSPFIHKSLPGMHFDVREQSMTEEEAFAVFWNISGGKWSRGPEFPSGYIVEGHAMLARWGEGGAFAVEASRGCMRSCFNYLEKRGAVDQTFHGGSFIKRPRWVLSSDCDGKHTEE